MSEETHDENVNQNAETDDGASNDVSGLSPEQLKEELSKVRREAASRRIELKGFKEKAEKWEEHERSQMTEIDKLKADLADKDQKLSLYELDKLKVSVAKDVGLDAEDAELLSGSDEATLRAHAEKLKSRLGTKQEESKNPVDLLAGKRGTPIGGSSTTSSIDDLIRASARRL